MMRKKEKEKVYIPLDIWEEIAVNLPIKSIARFRLVSKSWNERFTGLRFLEKNFELVRKESKINFKAMVCNGDNLYSLEFDPSGGNPRVIMMNHTFLQSDGGISEYTRIMGSCKGIICVLAHIGCGDVYLWNPTTSQFKDREGCSLPKDPDEVCDWTYLYYGFGYNAVDRDFRLVEILSTDEAEYQSHVHVYGLHKSSWRQNRRKIDYFRIPYFVHTEGGILINGNLHWPAYRLNDSKKYDHLVIAFNIYNGKEFKEVELPDLESKKWYVCSVGVLNGLLTVSFGDWKDKTKFEVWIMLDYGRKESWRNLFKITSSIRFRQIVPLCFLSNGTEILLCDSGDFYLYDFKDQALNNYEIHNLPQGTYRTITSLDSNV